MNSQPPDDPVIQLNRSDALLLAAITEGSHDGRAVSLPDFLNDYDWLDRALPTFDEMSFGIPRLMAVGYMTVDRHELGGLALRATPKAIALRRSVTGQSLGGVLFGVMAAVDAVPYPDPEPPEDRSLGRLAGFEPADLAAADQRYRAWFDRTSKPIVALARFALRGRKRRP